MIKFFNLFFCFIISFPFCFGLDKNPEIKRVCLDYSTSTITISWQSINDTCNSFQKNVIYSSENEGQWVKILEIFNKNINEISYSIGNLTSVWKYKIVSYTSCNNIDSFTSAAVYIDKTPPSNIYIDSVSFDMNSQNIIIGWSVNTSPDIKGYKIYKYYNSVNDFISYSYTTFIKLPFYTSTNPEHFTVASFDSCNLYSLISPPQKAVYLSGKYDTCKKSITLNWSNYEGWQNKKVFLILNRNKNGFKDIIDVSNLNSYNLNILSSDKYVSFLIRTINNDNGYTSSSNIINFNIKTDSIPSFMYLSNVTVEENSFLKISLEIDAGSTFDSLFVFKQFSSSKPEIFATLIKQSNSSHYEFLDYDVAINSESYQYFAKCINVCKDTLKISNKGKSILLKHSYQNDENYTLIWNAYSGWQAGVKEQYIQNKLNNTWNTSTISPVNNFKFNLDNLIQNQDSICFRILDVENKSIYNTENHSFSNALCFKKQGQYFFPHSINPLSNINNVFKIYGNNLDILESKLEIFNRWGAKIFDSNDIISGWNFKINDKPINLGTYFFKAYLKDQNNNSHYFNGTIIVIY
ncbi:MAG: gliding motility-associated C-terminal domain-containing protein [Bacteroidetes bacterium]|nr:gliding motility-associated C-terminal domain-containing protein [Bacteroidota bacterium]